MQFIRTNWLPLLVILIGGAFSLFLALRSFEFVFGYLVIDDSFYYFQIARNIVHGLGSTFDGVHLTNGYHPLWLLGILPVLHYLSASGVHDFAPIQGVLVLSAFLYAATGVVLLAIIGRYTKNAWVKVGALGFWFFNPFVQYQMLNGLETSLSVFFIALFFLSCIRVGEKPTTRRFVETGIIGGLMMLARLDNVFYFLGYLAYLAYRDGVKKSVRPILVSGIAATILVAPWLLFNFVNFGMLFTSSSLASTMVNHQLIVQDHGPSWFQSGKAVAYFTDNALRDLEPQTGIPLILLLMSGLCIGYLAFGRGRALLDRYRIPVELFVASGFVLDFIANASIRWTVRPWYFIAVDLLIAIWLAWFLEKLREEGYMRPLVATVLILFSLSVFYINWSREISKSKNSMPVDIIKGTVWMNENVPKGAVIGAFNAGVQGYFSTHRVVNLDGLVNNSAFAALKEKKLWQYIHDEKIDYLADYDVYIGYRYNYFLGVDNVFDHLQFVYEPVSRLRVYKVK